MQRFLHFLSYNNAVPIAVSVVILGAGGAFAATDPQAIYSAQQRVVAVDNTYIANKDLSSFTPRVEIVSVTEDSDNYYVAYRLYTIDLKDAVWQDVTKDQTLTVSKPDLGPYRDLGVYVTQQLKQITDRELAYLKDVQNIERKNVSQKIVATQYGGLVGKFLDPSTETLPGYTPVIVPPPAPDASASAAVSVSVSTVGTQAGGASTAQAAPSGNSTLRIQMLGNNPAQIALGSSYVDLGATASDAQGDNIRIETYLDGTKMEQVAINTHATSTHTIRYVALDPRSNSIAIERTVIVYDPANGPPVASTEVQSGQSAGAALPQNVPALNPVPASTPAPSPQQVTPEPVPTPPPIDTATTTPTQSSTTTAPSSPPPATSASTSTTSTSASTTTSATTTSPTPTATPTTPTATSTTTTASDTPPTGTAASSTTP